MTILGGCCNILGMYILIHYTNLGIYAVQLTTAGVATFMGLIFNPLYSAYCLKFPIYIFYPTLGRHIITCIVMGVAFFGLAKLAQHAGWLGLIACACVEVLVGAAIYFVLMFSKAEKQRVCQTVLSRLKRQ